MVKKLTTVASLVALAGSVASESFPLNLKRHRASLESKSTSGNGEDLSLDLVNQDSFYSVELDIGTPAQKVTVLLDTGSSDLWVMSSSNPYCKSSSSGDGTIDCNTYGTFDSAKSSTYKKLNYDENFQIEYVDGTQAEGVYFTDDFLINNIAVSDITAALATETNSSMGVMGISYEADEGNAQYFTYPNFPVALKNSGAISKIAYSLFLNSLCDEEGSLLFGAVDHSLYTGQLYTIPLVNIYPQYYSEPFEFDVTVHGVGLVGWESSDQQKTLTQTKFPAVLDSGTTLIALPPNLIGSFAEAVGATYSDSLGWYELDCPTDAQTLEAAYVFDFGGVNIYSPVKNFIYTTNDANVCVLGVEEFTSNGGIYDNYGILGDVVLSAMYVVYDLEDYEVSIAQANYAGFDGESDIEEIISTVPGAVQAPGYYSTWSSWAEVSIYQGDGEGIFTNPEKNPWVTTSDFGCSITAASNNEDRNSVVTATVAATPTSTSFNTSLITAASFTKSILEKVVDVNSSSIATSSSDNAGMKYGASFGAIIAALALIF